MIQNKNGQKPERRPMRYFLEDEGTNADGSPIYGLARTNTAEGVQRALNNHEREITFEEFKEYFRYITKNTWTGEE